MAGMTSRVLFSTWPAHGHLLPMLPLARPPSGAGHDVVIASGAEGAAEARRRGFTVWDVGPSRREAEEQFRAAAPDLAGLAETDRMPTIIAGMFGAAALRRAPDLVPLAERWQPDLVVHPITELAGAVAAELTGARRLVHGFGPLPAQAWDWFGARFGELCDVWGVPGLVDTVLDAPFAELCPPSLQRDAVGAFTRRVPLRPGSGDPVPGERLPWTAAQLDAPALTPTRCTSRSARCSSTRSTCSARALAGLRELHVNVLVTVGPGRDPASLGPQPAHVLVADFATH